MGGEGGEERCKRWGGGARARTKGEEVVARLGVDGDIINLACSVMILCLLVSDFLQASRPLIWNSCFVRVLLPPVT